MDGRLRTDRLTIRRFVGADLGDLVELHNDPSVMHYLNNGQPVPSGEVAEELRSWIDGYRESDRVGFWAVAETITGRFVGWVHLRAGDGCAERELELGFRLRRSCWGHGFAAEASRAVIDRAFTEMSIDRVLAHTMSVHRASRRAMEKAGLRLIRTFRADWPVRIPGDEYGDVEYAQTRPEWAADRASARSSP